MKITDMLEVAKAAAEARIAPTAKKLAAGLVQLLDREPPPACWHPVTDARSVHLPREANRCYTPNEARELAVAILRAADKAEAYEAVRTMRTDTVPR